MKSLVPLLAMVPRWSIASCWLMPMPLSVMVRVLAALSKATRTSRLGASSNSAALFSAFKTQLVAGVRRVGDQLAQEDFLVGVQRMGDEVQQLRHFGLEGKGLLAHREWSGSRKGNGLPAPSSRRGQPAIMGDQPWFKALGMGSAKPGPVGVALKESCRG